MTQVSMHGGPIWTAQDEVRWPDWKGRQARTHRSAGPRRNG
jgi:hypothetical protein